MLRGISGMCIFSPTYISWLDAGLGSFFVQKVVPCAPDPQSVVSPADFLLCVELGHINFRDLAASIKTCPALLGRKPVCLLPETRFLGFASLS